jgi:energy-coupling factor transporter ATP-binding protein EcfA2
VLEEPESRRERGRVSRPARPVGLRQVHPAQLHRGPARCHRTGRSSSRAQRHLGAAQGSRHRHGVPVLRALSADDGRGQSELRAEEPGHAAPRSRSGSTAPPDPADRTLLQRKPARFRAGSASASPSAGRWCATPMCSCSTSRLSNLDAKLRSELRVEIKRLHQKLHNTMIYVTHDQIEALTLADRIAVMKGGKIQQLDDPHDDLQPAAQPVRGRVHRLAVDEFPDGHVAAKGSGFSFPLRRTRNSADGYVADGGVKAADGAILGVRPEHVEIRHEDDVGQRLYPANGRSGGADGRRQPGVGDRSAARRSRRASIPRSVSGRATRCGSASTCRWLRVFDKQTETACKAFADHERSCFPSPPSGCGSNRLIDLAGSWSLADGERGIMRQRSICRATCIRHCSRPG